MSSLEGPFNISWINVCENVLYILKCGKYYFVHMIDVMMGSIAYKTSSVPAWIKPLILDVA